MDAEVVSRRTWEEEDATAAPPLPAAVVTPRRLGRGRLRTISVAGFTGAVRVRIPGTRAPPHPFVDAALFPHLSFAVALVLMFVEA
jgi:hypothetical protein